jgi:hypothetical protein
MNEGTRVARRHPTLPEALATIAALAVLALACSGPRSGPRTGTGEGTAGTDADAVGATPADGQWHEAARGTLAAVQVERRLYERAGDEHFLVRVRVDNLADRPLGLELRDYWTVVYPNQWGALATEQRLTIDESRMPARVMDAARCHDLRRGFAAGELTAIPAGGAAEYYREFNASGRADVDAQAVERFVYASLAGQTLVTDGEDCENLPLDWGPSGATANTDLRLAAPVAWAAVPEGAEVVDSGRTHAVPRSPAGEELATLAERSAGRARALLPGDDAECANLAEYPHYWTYGGSGDPDAELVARLGELCSPIGPHRGMNIERWCCPPAAAAPAPGLDAVPARLSLVLALPSPADARFLNVSIDAAAEAWNLTGCESNVAGACDRTRLCPLSAAERAAYAQAVAAVRGMPRCEPLGYDSNYFSVELTLDGQLRKTWMPPGWFRLAGGDGPPPAGADPCLAELHLAWWIYTAFDACGRPPAPAMPRCHESCCAPALQRPAPDGTIECCFCTEE